MVLNLSDDAVILIADALHAYENMESRERYKNLTEKETDVLLDLMDTFDGEAMDIQNKREDRDNQLLFSDDGTDYPDEPAMHI